MKQRSIILIFCLNSGFLLHAQEGINYIKAGNDYYKEKQFEKAAKEYEKVLKTDSLYTIARFNLGNAQYRSNKKDEATSTFKKLITSESNSKEASRLYYNEGVILTNQQNLEESIEAYKNALRQDPDDKDARENLQKALLELKKNTTPPKIEKKKQPQQSKINPKEAQQKLKQLEQKEKQVQQRMQNQKTQTDSQRKDW
jgi:Ca-activated chloride channel family protein